MKIDTAIERFGALAQETRLSVFRLLVQEGPEGLPAGEIARRMGTPANTMSSNLAILERAGLVVRERQGRSIIYRPDMAGARELLLYLVEDCCRGRPEICAPLMAVAEEACRCGPASPEGSPS